MIRSSSDESSPPLKVNVGPRTETPFDGARVSVAASIRNEVAGASFCFLNMGNSLRCVLFPRKHQAAWGDDDGAVTPMIDILLKRSETHLTVWRPDQRTRWNGRSLR